MHIRLVLSLFTITSSFSLYAQTAPPQKINNDVVPMRIEVRNVPLEVVVTDKSGNFISGLRKEDFAVLENRDPQSILSFEEINGQTRRPMDRPASATAANTYTNDAGDSTHAPLYLLYYDMLNTWREDQMDFHQQLLRFLDHAEPGAQFALFINTDKAKLVQGFTTDKRKIAEAFASRGEGHRVPQVFLGGTHARRSR